MCGAQELASHKISSTFRPSSQGWCMYVCVCVGGGGGGFVYVTGLGSFLLFPSIHAFSCTLYMYLLCKTLFWIRDSKVSK